MRDSIFESDEIDEEKEDSCFWCYSDEIREKADRYVNSRMLGSMTNSLVRGAYLEGARSMEEFMQKKLDEEVGQWIARCDNLKDELKKCRVALIQERVGNLCNGFDATEVMKNMCDIFGNMKEEKEKENTDEGQKE